MKYMPDMRVIIKYWIPLALLIACVWAWFSFGWIFFVKPGNGGTQMALPITAVAGSPIGAHGFADGTGERVLMHKPIRLAKLDDKTLVFADINNHAIRTITSDGKVSTLAGGPDKKGYQDGPAETAKFKSPHGVAVRSDGVIAVAEAGNHTIRLVTPVAGPSGTRYTVTTMAGTPGQSGMKDGPSKEALFYSPHALVWDVHGDLLVADIGNARIRRIHEGKTITVAGRDKAGKQDGDLYTGTLKYPMDITLDGNGNLWIVDSGVLTLRKWNSGDGLTTPFPGLKIAMPHGISFVKDRYVVVAEMNGHRILAYDIKSGQVSTLCGTTVKGHGQGQLNRPAAVLADNDKIWIADLGNHRIVTIPVPK